MAHVTYGQGILPVSWFNYVKPKARFSFFYFNKVSSLPRIIEEMGISFTPREFSYFFWNCRRLQLTYSARYKFQNPSGSSFDQTYTQSYKVPTLRTNFKPYRNHLQKNQERLLMGTVRPEGIDFSSSPTWPAFPTWDCSSGRIPEFRTQGQSFGFWRANFRINSILDLIADQNGTDMGILTTDDVIPQNYNRKIIWPLIYADVGFITNGQGTGAGTSLPTDRSNLFYQQRGNFHFLNFPPVPLYMRWNGNGPSAASYFSIDQSTFDMRVSWPQTTPEDRDIYNWPYADPRDGRYSDGLDPAPDILGNF